MMISANRVQTSARVAELNASPLGQSFIPPSFPLAPLGQSLLEANAAECGRAKIEEATRFMSDNNDAKDSQAPVCRHAVPPFEAWRQVRLTGGASLLRTHCGARELLVKFERANARRVRTRKRMTAGEPFFMSINNQQVSHTMPFGQRQTGAPSR